MKVVTFEKRPLIFILASLPLLLIVWEIICWFGNMPSYLIPRPSLIGQTAYMLRGEIPMNLCITLMEAFFGFICGSLGGVILGALCSLSRKAQAIIVPYAIALKTIPVIAIAPLLTIWFGTNIISKTVLVVLMCFFPVFIGTLRGLLSVPTEHIDLFRSIAATDWQTFRWLRWPNALPFVFSGLRISVVFSVIGAIVAEFAGAKYGIGFQIMMASYQIETPKMFVYIIASAVLGILGYGIIYAAERIFVPWNQPDEY